MTIIDFLDKYSSLVIVIGVVLHAPFIIHYSLRMKREHFRYKKDK